MASAERSHLTALLDSAATILLIVVTLLVGSITLRNRLHPQAGAERPEPILPGDPLSITDAPIRGDRKARIAIIEFSDFECPYCGRSAREVTPQIEREYVRTGKVFLVWRQYPLSIHEHALKAAEAAECAGRQGKFWDFHDWLFQHQKELDQTNLRAAAKPLGLDQTAFEVCLDGQAIAKVKADVDLGNTLSITGTPTWFIGVVQQDGTVKVTERLNGAKAFADFQKAIDKVITSVEGSGKGE